MGGLLVDMWWWTATALSIETMVARIHSEARIFCSAKLRHQRCHDSTEAIGAASCAWWTRRLLWQPERDKALRHWTMQPRWSSTSRMPVELLVRMGHLHLPGLPGTRTHCGPTSEEWRIGLHRTNAHLKSLHTQLRREECGLRVRRVVRVERLQCLLRWRSDDALTHSVDTCPWIWLRMPWAS